MDEHTERTQGEGPTEAADKAMLDRLEALLSGGLPDPGTDGDGGDPTFYSFCAQLAATVPVADDRFREQLLARLVDRPSEAAEAQSPAAIAATPPASQLAAVTNRTRASGLRVWNLFGKPRGTRGNTHNDDTGASSGRRKGRAVALMMGTAGVVILLALFVGMSTMLKLRQDANKASTTPTAGSAVPSDSSRLLPGIAPVQTLGTSGVQFVALSHDGSLLATGYGSNVEV